MQILGFWLTLHPSILGSQGPSKETNMKLSSSIWLRVQATLVSCITQRQFHNFDKIFGPQDLAGNDGQLLWLCTFSDKIKFVQCTL